MRHACLAAAAVAVAGALAPLHAQGAWDAILNIQPYPSPYYSDWDVDPHIATLTVFNRTASGQQVRIFFNISDRTNRIVLSATSGLQPVGAGATVIFENPYEIEGTTTRDAVEDELAARTGRLREGDYTACAVVADQTGFSLAESCADFTIVYPDPPLLLGPDNGGALDQPDPLFQWTPVQVPIAFQLSYVMRVVEVLSGQTPADALRSNIPHYQSLDGTQPSLRYPIDARPFEEGKLYAWTVQVLDQNGYAAAANDGRSEIWTFRYGAAPPVTTTSVSLLVKNSGTEASADTVAGLSAICPLWDSPQPINNVTYPLQSSFAFPGTTKVFADLVRDTLPGTNGQRAWALWGSTRWHTIMMVGDCGITNLETRTRWIGMRTRGDAQELSNWITTDTVFDQTGESPAKLKFGVAVLSRFEQTIGGRDDLAPIEEFLEGYEVDIKPGLNLHGVFDATQWKPLWRVLQAIGHEATSADIDITGFVGLNVNAGVEGRIGSEETSGGMVATAEYVTFSAKMPERKFDSGPIKSLRTGIELSFSDTLGVGRKQDRNDPTQPAQDDQEYSHHLALKLLLDAVTQRDITWTGALEFDWNLSDDPCFTCAAPTLRLTTDHQWQPFEGADLKLGNPEIAIGINDGLKAALWSRDTDSIRADVTMRGSLIWHDEDVAKLAVTFGRHRANPESMQRTEARIAAARLLDSTAVAEMNKATERGDTAAANAWRSKHRDHVTDIGNWLAQLRADSSEVNRKRKEDPTKTPDQVKPDKNWYWRASLTLGNMGLGNLLDLVGSTVRAMAARRNP